jgi:hypothetical protein
MNLEYKSGPSHMDEFMSSKATKWTKLQSWMNWIDKYLFICVKPIIYLSPSLLYF